MQVFVPYADPKEVAKCLDIVRLNKQVIEANWIIRCIELYEHDIDERHLKHPVAKMYKDHLAWLKYYRDVLNRYKYFFNDSCWDGLKEPEDKPAFLSYQPLLDCHKKRLYQKGLRDQTRLTRPHNHYERFKDFNSDNEENIYIVNNEVLTYLEGKLIRKEPLSL